MDLSCVYPEQVTVVLRRGLAWHTKKGEEDKELVVRSLCGANDGAVVINVQSDLIALAVSEGIGAVEGGFDGRSDGVLDTSGGRVSKYRLLVSFLRLSLER
jgi:hypothetical protein